MFTCTSSLPDSLDKQRRTRADLNVKQADMYRLKFRGAFPAHSVITASNDSSLPLSTAQPLQYLQNISPEKKLKYNQGHSRGG